MKQHIFAAALGLSAVTLPSVGAQAQTVAELQKQINELKAMVAAQAAANAPRRGTRGMVLTARNTDAGTIPAAGRPVVSAASPVHHKTAAEHAAEHPFHIEDPETWWPAIVPPDYDPLIDKPGTAPKTWFERIQIRGYTQLRGNEFIAGDRTAPAGISRLRGVNDGGITDKNNFTFRRVRLIIQGDIHERVFLYLQPDFAVSVAGQSGTEQRLHFAALRDAFADVFLDDERRTKLRFGQQKVPYGWENLQSSQNRLALDRSDGINSAVPGERDIGITAYYTPWHVQAIWDRLAKSGQKLFGNYGTFGVGIYNGQTINRVEQNDALMVAGMVTWPFELDGLGPWAKGQVVEFGASAYHNRFRPEVRLTPTAGTTLGARDFEDARLGLHAILYPQPFGIQAEWNWGRGPEFDVATRTIQSKGLEGGYIQAMYKVDDSPVGPFYPYLRFQHYDGGYKSSVNTPRLASDEVEVGIEFQPIKQVELTLAYAKRRANEADERRFGRAEGDLFRGQLQINY
ncbi:MULTISPECIES: porin [Methylobacterium]|uniref:Porin n=1 Tax=Methylobacterium thuringiense TaxID=1003091 RepID=A0ABQ4TMH1_9HYPH|nr:MULTISPECIES: porin [Methylobacterium]TXN21203.1 porin [Methylobacterium sp. WL9]GJE56549.1 hypothetical protein EKPJFOCH_3056 [Methylobacterium thuringiense]